MKTFALLLALGLAANGAVLENRNSEPLTEEDFKTALTAHFGDGTDEDQSPDLFEGDIELNDEDKASYHRPK